LKKKKEKYMKSLLKVAMGLLILSGAGLAVTTNAIAETSKPVVQADVNASADVNTDTKMTTGKTDVNETDSVEINRASIHDSEISIRATRKDVDRDTQKLTDDTENLKDAQEKNDDKAIAKAKADIGDDQSAINKDRERLKKHISEKIEKDRAIVRKYDEKINNTRKDVARDSRKLSDDTAKLADAQSKNAADAVEKAKADVDADQAMVNADTTKLNNRIAYKAECVVDLKNDRRHLEAVVKHLSDDDQASISGDAAVNGEASAQ
jgi:hypothetical protein